MSNQQANGKIAYIKPTLIEYGSLAQRTKIFGIVSLDPTPEALITTVAPSATTLISA